MHQLSTISTLQLTDRLRPTTARSALDCACLLAHAHPERIATNQHCINGLHGKAGIFSQVCPEVHEIRSAFAGQP